jgi:hypothetical protein
VQVRLLVGLALFSLIASRNVVAQAASNTISACVKKSNGALRVLGPVGHCKNSESPIQWNITGPQGPTGPIGSQGPQGPGGLLLEDAVGNAIGPYDLNNRVTIKAGGVPVAILADTGFEELSFSFFHDSPDCSGLRYLNEQDPAVYAAGFTSDGKTAYYPPLGSTAVVELGLGTGSVEQIAQGADPTQPGTCSPLVSSELDPYVPAQSFDLTVFTPPFHLQ